MKNVNNENVKSSDTIKMVSHALAVLDLLRQSNKRLGVNDIAKQCNLGPSTAFRILNTLKDSGWVYKCNDDRYMIGEKISFVLEKNNLNLALKEVAYFVMQRYTNEYQQAMNLIVRDGANCYIIQQSRTNNLVDYIPAQYSNLPFYACAGGKILLYELPIVLIENIINSCEMVPLTPNTITKPDVLWKELRAIAQNGYAFDNKESAANGSCIAVPVRDHEGTIIAALSFSGFIGIDDTDDLLKYVPVLQKASAEITADLFNCYNR